MMKMMWFVLLLMCASPVLGEGKYFEHIKTFAIPEARQGVAVDDAHFYAIGSRQIAKYEKHSGKLVRKWVEDEGGPIVHLDSGVIVDGKLICSHSNYPEIPMTSSVEIWDADTLEHIESHSFGIGYGSCTWIDRHVGYWWVTFAHYEKFKAEIGKGTKWTTLVKMDDQWRPLESWVFPQTVLDRFYPMSNSGGSWGPDDKLYVTGHDHSEVYVMQLPKRGSMLVQVGTLAVDNKGQGIAWDRTDPCMLYTIKKKEREVGVHRLRK